MRRRIVMTAGVIGLLGCKRVQPLPVYNTVPAFTLTDSDGRAFDGLSLAGKPWVASFFFASCNGPCPRMNTALSALQEKTYRFSGLRLVSFTVDPVRDTPEVLAAYAKRYRADGNRWTFLTGSTTTLNQLSEQVFQLGKVDGSLAHSTRLILVDGRGSVRGFYQGLEEDGPATLLSDIERLYKEES